jgi:uncharacterized membrane protein
LRSNPYQSLPLPATPQENGNRLQQPRADNMSWPGVAIAVHVLGVVWWLGGLTFVTLVFLPALRREFNDNPHLLLQTIERRFAPQARIALILVGLSGGYLLTVTGLWNVLSHAAFWWLDAMIAYWLLFAMMLFVIEPLGIMQRLISKQDEPPARGWQRFHVLHGVLLALGVIVVAAAAAGGHGY